MFRILLVEDDTLISKSLKMSLTYNGFEAVVCNTCATGAESIARQDFDLLILDVNLPDGTGFDLCRQARELNPHLPIIMLTAKVDEESAVRGMTVGADDYVRKPFGVNELVVRMKKLLDKKVTARTTSTFGALKMDLKKRLAWADTQELNLGKREFEILRLLMQKQGEVTTRDEILSALGEDDAIYDRTIDSHLSHLRKKIREANADKIHITPVYGVGYRLEEK